MMKFKKTMLLVFVLILVVGLTGCDNWQNGIDEFENATGPSWNLDLSIPLLPATSVDVGERIAEELDEDFEIEEDGSFKRSFLSDEDETIFDKTIEIEELNSNGNDSLVVDASRIADIINPESDYLVTKDISIPELDFDESNEYLKLAIVDLVFSFKLSSDLEGLEFVLEDFIFEIGNESINVNEIIESEGFVISSNENRLPEEVIDELIELIVNGDETEETLIIKIESVAANNPDKEFEIESNKKYQIKLIAEMNFYPEFEFVADDNDSDNFIYRAEPTELELDQETRDSLKNNLKSVEVVQEIVNDLPFVGEIEIFIREDEVDKDSFYDDKNENVYSSNLIRLEKNDQKYRYQEELDEGFIEALIEEGPVYIGFRIKIPLAENSPVRFSINDRIELKMWSNVTVKVNSQN